MINEDVGLSSYREKLQLDFALGSYLITLTKGLIIMHVILLALSLLMTPALAQRQAIKSRCQCTLQHHDDCLHWVCDWNGADHVLQTKRQSTNGRD